jgi:hypothetical protein
MDLAKLKALAETNQQALGHFILSHTREEVLSLPAKDQETLKAELENLHKSALESMSAYHSAVDAIERAKVDKWSSYWLSKIERGQK